MSTEPAQFRHFTPDDIPAMHAVREAAAKEDGVDPHSTLESMPKLDEFTKLIAEHAERFGTDDIVIATDSDGNIVGYGMLEGRLEEKNGDSSLFVYLHSGYVHPDHRHRKIGSAMLTELQQRIRKYAHEEHKGKPSENARKFFGTSVSETQPHTKQLLDKHGYGLFWQSMEMKLTDLSKVKPNPEASIPPAYELLQVPDDDTDLKLAIYNANQAVYESPEVTAEDKGFQKFVQQNPESSLWKVLRDRATGQIAAFVISRITHNDPADGVVAEVVEVSTLPAYRGQKLASLLMYSTLGELLGRDIHDIHLHTDANNGSGARDLYEKVGFTKSKVHDKVRTRTSF